MSRTAATPSAPPFRRNAGLVVRGRAGRRGHASDRAPQVTRPVGLIGWLVIERLFGAHDRRSDLRGIANPWTRSRRGAEAQHRARVGG